jgi:hypothetical protein
MNAESPTATGAHDAILKSGSRRRFLQAAGFGGATLLVPTNLTASKGELTADVQQCDVLGELRAAAEVNPQADLLFRALNFSCTPIPDEPTQEQAAQQWEIARQIFQDAADKFYIFPLVVPPQVTILDEAVALEPALLPSYTDFLAAEAELCELLGTATVITAQPTAASTLTETTCDNPVIAIILKIMAAIGLRTTAADLKALVDFIRENVGEALTRLLNAISSRDRAAIKAALAALGRALTSDAFLLAAERLVGRTLIRSLGRLLARYLTGFGLLIFAIALAIELVREIS